MAFPEDRWAAEPGRDFGPAGRSRSSKLGPSCSLRPETPEAGTEPLSRQREKASKIYHSRRGPW